MLDLYLCVTQDHHLSVIAMAAVVCIVSTVAGILMLDRARDRRRATALTWLTAGALVWAGGVWATHFVAMLGYDVGVPLSFDLPQTLLSAAIIIVIAGLGFTVLHNTVASGSASPAAAALAGAVLGAGVSTMHFVGMYGVLVPADLVWDRQFVAMAIFLGVAFGALSALSYALVERPLLRIAMTAVMSVAAVCSLHFIGMAALTLVPYGAPSQLEGVDPQMMAVTIGMAALLLVVASLCAASIDMIVSERRQAEETRLREIIEQLRESEHRALMANRAKSAFLSRMSHEFRTPLNGVIGIATMLQGQVEARHTRMLEMIVQSGRSLGGMIDDILVLARLEDGDFELDCRRFRVSTLLAEAEAAFRGRAEERGLTLHVTDATEKGETLEGDPERIAQVLKCLMSNAVKFTASGEIRLEAAAMDAPNGGGRTLTLTVEDTGAGVTDEAEAEIFEQFGQADSSITRKHDGAGLGLTLAQMLCARMGGRLYLEHPEEGGARFCVELTLARGENASGRSDGQEAA